MDCDDSEEAVAVQRLLVERNAVEDRTSTRRAFPGDDDDRDGPQAPVTDLCDAKVRSVHDRHAQIEQNQGRAHAVVKPTETFAAVADGYDGVAVCFEERLRRSPKTGVIFDQEDHDRRFVAPGA